MSDVITDLVPFITAWRGESHQRAAMAQLLDAMPPDLRRRDAAWYRTWAGPAQAAARTNPLQVTYFSQRDSATEHAQRMCFSSSCAMLLEALRPGTLPGPNGDDAYLGRVLRFGDTTEAAAQIRALQSYGVQAEFTQRSDWSTIERQIDQGIPVPLGILHRGHIGQPSGTGHWILAIGYDSEAITVHDPFGDLDLVAGIYRNRWGPRLRYSRRNLAPRWMAEGIGTGWAIVATR